MTISRRGLLGLAAAGAGLALAGCASGPGGSASAAASAGASGSAAKATIGLTYIPNVQFAPFYVAASQNLYRSAGVDVTLRHHGASEALFTALVSGQEDFVVAGADEMIQARSQGMDLVAIAPYYRQYPVVLIVKEASPIKSAADLKGRSIGIPGRYGESWFGLKVLLASAGLTEADVKIAEIGYTQQAALTTDKVDSIIGFSNNDVVTFVAGGVPVRTIALTATGAPPLVSICLITTQAYLDAHGDLAKKVADASVAGQAAVVKDPAQALTISTDYVTTLKTDDAARTAAGKTLEATVPLWAGTSGVVDAKLDAAQFATMATFMKAQGLITTDVDPTKAMSNAYHS